MRGGWWPGKRPKFPLVLGTDGAGTIAALGEGVRRFRRGEQVWAYEFINPKGGFYAEQVAVKAENVGRVPRRLDLVHAGAAAVTGLTAQQGIDKHLRVRKGETVLIFGASGAVGTLAIQFAKRHDARIIATASGKKAKLLVRRLGADGVFDARGKRAVEDLRKLAPRGIDAVLALAGGESLDRCLEVVRSGGRVAYPNGVEPEPRHRANLRQFSYDAKGGRRAFDDLRRAAQKARLGVPIAKVYTLAQASKAHAQIERGGVVGRIVLRIR
jgi:NADPH:quinone reductase-like Zn-dependent oxidoreductase